MLTNEEALRLIKECDECFVVWATDLNAIVAVHPIPAEEDRLNALQSMGTGYEGPTKGRFFKSRDVTLQTLQDEQAEMTRVATRIAIFNSWKNCSIDELIDTLIERRFYEPMDVFHGSSHIINRLYRIHGPQLTTKHLARLEQFAQTPNLAKDQKCAQEELQCYLAVMQNEPDRLKLIWKRHHNPKVDWSTWDAFTDAAGDLPTQDQDIIAQLIEIVEASYMFGPRWRAMVALGKIGPSSGLHAVEVIEKSIYDSSDHITALRYRVVARIRQPASDWIQCTHCSRGHVDGIGYGSPTIQPCTECFGLGHIPVSGVT